MYFAIFAPVGGLGECTPLPTNVRNTLKQNPKSKLRAYRAIARNPAPLHSAKALYGPRYSAL